MHRTLAAIVLAIGLVACAPNVADFAVESSPLQPDACLYVSVSPGCLDTAEQLALSKAKERAERRGQELVLALSDGTQRTFQDSDTCESVDRVSECFKYLLHAYLPSRNTFVIHKGFYEGSADLLVNDRTGRITELSTTPRFGADARRFLVIDDDYAYGSEWELQIWRWEADGAVLEWRRMAGDEPSPHLIDLVRWDRAGEIFLEMHTEASLGEPELRWPARLYRAGREWRLEMDPPR
jgi:hypothetical protein